MIVVPAWAAVMVLGLLPVVGLAAYSYGWWLRGRQSDKIVNVNRPMTAAEQEQFRKTFLEVDKFFDIVRGRK